MVVTVRYVSFQGPLSKLRARNGFLRHASGWLALLRTYEMGGGGLTPGLYSLNPVGRLSDGAFKVKSNIRTHSDCENWFGCLHRTLIYACSSASSCVLTGRSQVNPMRSCCPERTSASSETLKGQWVTKRNM